MIAIKEASFKCVMERSALSVESSASMSDHERSTCASFCSAERGDSCRYFILARTSNTSFGASNLIIISLIKFKKVIEIIL